MLTNFTLWNWGMSLYKLSGETFLRFCI